jgi:hypothetical protein
MSGLNCFRGKRKKEKTKSDAKIAASSWRYKSILTYALNGFFLKRLS